MRIQKSLFILFNTVLFLLGSLRSAYGQKPYRQGTTAANFLEIGYGSAGCAMGDAYVSVVNDLSAVYWNPAGLAFMDQNEALFSYQPWLVDIYTTFAAVGLVSRQLGTFALAINHIGYGSMEVTTMEMQEGTGEKFDASDFSVSISYSRKLAQWFSFGGSGKYVSSKIWHMNANAIALDLGVIIQTRFLSMTNKHEDGLNIGMCISNYGTKMRYTGMDLLNPIDILPGEAGNYRAVPGQFRTEGWELPLIFRVGIAFHPIVHSNHRLTVAVDALHPNNNNETLNLGVQYVLKHPSLGSFFLRGGYKGLYMEDSEFGPTFGGGMLLRMMHNLGMKVEYAFRGVGLLGDVHSYTIGFLF